MSYRAEGERRTVWQKLLVKAKAKAKADTQPQQRQQQQRQWQRQQRYIVKAAKRKVNGYDGAIGRVKAHAKHE